MTESVQSETETMPQDPFDGELTLLDRCDRCGAAAVIRAVMNGGIGELLFCGHHGREYQPALIKVSTLYGELWS